MQTSNEENELNQYCKFMLDKLAQSNRKLSIKITQRVNGNEKNSKLSELNKKFVKLKFWYEEDRRLFEGAVGELNKQERIHRESPISCHDLIKGISIYLDKYYSELTGGNFKS